MFNSNPGRSHSRRSFTLFLLIILVWVSAFLYADRVAILLFNKFTDYRLSCEKWGRSPLSRSEIYGLTLEFENKGVAVKAKKVSFDLNLRQSLAKKAVVISCKAEDLSLITVGGDKTEFVSSDDVLAMPFDPGTKYDRVGFTVYLGRKLFNLFDFEADSKDIRVEGSYTFSKVKNEVSLNVKVSFSPEIYAGFSENLSARVLSPDDDGWYSTVINYSGNPIFLKALYTIALPQ